MTGEPRCPVHEREMNLHARKLADPRTPEEARLADRDLGGIETEVFACPECWRSAERRALGR